MQNYANGIQCLENVNAYDGTNISHSGSSLISHLDKDGASPLVDQLLVDKLTITILLSYADLLVSKDSNKCFSGYDISRVILTNLFLCSIIAYYNLIDILCSDIKNFVPVSCFCLRRDVALGNFQSDHAEVQR